jgi:hypothetical protein
VTVLRSPSAIEEPPVWSAAIRMPDALQEDADKWVASLAESADPQSPQKRLPGGLFTPHLGQPFPRGTPQSPQNLLSSGFSLPHFEQRIGSPIGATIRLIYHPDGIATTAPRVCRVIGVAPTLAAEIHARQDGMW